MINGHRCGIPLRVLLFIVLAVVGSQLGCLRFTPSRKEILEDQSDSGEAPTEYAGEEAFFSLEREQKRRLRDLVVARRRQLGNEGRDVYRVGVGDLIDVSVFDVEEMNRKVRVRPAGTISLPLIGAVKAAGLTESDLQDAIAKRLAKFVRDPEVQIFIEEYASHKVSVIGEVDKPGSYPLKHEGYSLLELISEAGGRSNRSGQTSGSIVILVPSREDSAPQDLGPSSRPSQYRTDRGRLNRGIEIYFDDLIGGLDEPPLDVPLVSGDTIIIPEGGKVQVDGEVKTPGSFELASKMTLLGAIAASGGLTYSADVKEIEVIRELGSGHKALITVDLEEIALRDGKDIRLRNGDVVRVPSHSGRFFTRQIVESINRMFSFGMGAGI